MALDYNAASLAAGYKTDRALRQQELQNLGALLAQYAHNEGTADVARIAAAPAMMRVPSEIANLKSHSGYYDAHSQALRDASGLEKEKWGIEKQFAPELYATNLLVGRAQRNKLSKELTASNIAQEEELKNLNANASLAKTALIAEANKEAALASGIERPATGIIPSILEKWNILSPYNYLRDPLGNSRVAAEKYWQGIDSQNSVDTSRNPLLDHIEKAKIQKRINAATPPMSTYGNLNMPQNITPNPTSSPSQVATPPYSRGYININGREY